MLVYFHRNPKTYEILYVGVGSRNSRAYEFHKGRNPRYRNYFSKYGKPIVQIVHTNLTKELAHWWERFYIALLKRKEYGGLLLNLTEGGDASPPIPYESRLRCIEALRKWIKANPDKNPTLKPEHSIRMKENNPMHNLEYVQKVRIANIGKKASNETKLKQSLLKKGKPSNQPKGYKHSDEVVQRMKIINKEIVSRPEVKAKLREQRLGIRKESNFVGVNMIDMHNDKVLKSFPSITDALLYLGKNIRCSNITTVCQGKRNKTFGYKWAYSTPEASLTV